MPDTSAQVLLVYVLSSKTIGQVSSCQNPSIQYSQPSLFHLHLLPNINATVSSLYSLPGRPLTDGFVIFSR